MENKKRCIFDSSKRNKMENLNTLITAAIEKGYKFEAYTNICGKYTDLTDSFNGGTDKSHFGFTKDGKVWFWFYQPNYKSSDFDSMAYFDHRYNTINGHTMYSFNQQWKSLEFLGLR